MCKYYVPILDQTASISFSLPFSDVQHHMTGKMV